MRLFDRDIPKIDWRMAVLWAAYIFALVASLQHLAWAFSTLEFPGYQWTGWLPAIAVDAGLAVLAYSIQYRRRTGRPTGWLWAGVGVFAAISALGNLLHAMTVENSGQAVLAATFGQLDGLTLLKAAVLSATLPLLVVYLGEVVSNDTEPAPTPAPTPAPVQPPAPIPTPEPEPLPVPPASGPNLPNRPPATVPGRDKRMVVLLKYLLTHPLCTMGEAGRATGIPKTTVSSMVADLMKTERLARTGELGWFATGVNGRGD